ncbi:Fic family protein [Helicobacter sp. L8]|uniref:Fic family protein n=1 Tax=Helicobacter sp. L8 TaxID=2316078 RepID=UPI001F09EBD4|nr:Fic family protein [Helicobacter sp. L8]
MDYNFSDFIELQGCIEKLRFDFIYSSAQIEGNTYSKLDTLALLEEGLTAGGKKYSDAKMILNLRNAFDMILKENLPISLETCQNLHAILSDELVTPNNCGIMRNHDITGIIGTSYLPLAYGDKLHTEMKFLFKTYETIEHPFERAIYLHNNLCYLQYFEDCNKRTARCMQFLSLKNDNKMPLVLIEDDPNLYKQYRGALIAYYESGDYQNYLDFFCKAYQKETEFLQEVQELNKCHGKSKK